MATAGAGKRDPLTPRVTPQSSSRLLTGVRERPLLSGSTLAFFPLPSWPRDVTHSLLRPAPSTFTTQVRIRDHRVLAWRPAPPVIPELCPVPLQLPEVPQLLPEPRQELEVPATRQRCPLGVARVVVQGWGARGGRGGPDCGVRAWAWCSGVSMWSSRQRGHSGEVRRY